MFTSTGESFANFVAKFAPSATPSKFREIWAPEWRNFHLARPRAERAAYGEAIRYSNWPIFWENRVPQRPHPNLGPAQYRTLRNLVKNEHPAKMTDSKVTLTSRHQDTIWEGAK